MNSPGLSSRIQPSGDVLFREMQGEAVLLNIQTGMYFGLDSTGTAIWQLIQKKSRLDKVLESLVEEFDIDKASCREDLLRFATTLQKNGLVEVHAD